MKVRCDECGALILVVDEKLAPHKRDGFRHLDCRGSGSSAISHAEAYVKRYRARETGCLEEFKHAEAALTKSSTEATRAEVTLAKLRKCVEKDGA